MNVKSKKILKFNATTHLIPFNYSNVQLKDSIFKNQFDEMKHYYLSIPNDDILKGFRERAGANAPGKNLGGWYTGDASFLLPRINIKKPTAVFSAFGQWLGAFARMYKVTSDPAILKKLEYLLDNWGQTIEVDGYFFYGTNPNALHYEFEKIVGGLVDIYEYVGREKSIECLRKITAWAIKNLNRRRIPATPDQFTGGYAAGGKDADTEWYTLSENLYRAYLLTGDTVYQDFAKIWHYNSYWDDLAEKKYCLTGLHAYSHVNTLSSAAMAYAVSGDISYLHTIVNAYKILQETQVFATGGYGPGERMANQCESLGNSLYLQENTFETPCCTWAVFKLVRYLMMFTGKAIYGDWIEKLLYNGIGASLPMAGKGKTYYYSDYRVNGGEKKYYSHAWPCCSGTYPLAVTDYHNIIYFKDKDSLYVNLFVPSQVEWNKSGQIISVTQNTDFPKTGRISLRINTSRPIDFSLKFRIPAWVKNSVSVKVNNTPLLSEWKSGRWGTINRIWNDGDIVDIKFPLNLYFLPVDNRHSHLAALTHGPVVLVADKAGVLKGDIESPSSWILPISEQDLVFQTKQQANARKFRPYLTYGEREKYYMYHIVEK